MYDRQAPEQVRSCIAAYYIQLGSTCRCWYDRIAIWPTYDEKKMKDKKLRKAALGPPKQTPWFILKLYSKGYVCICVVML